MKWSFDFIHLFNNIYLTPFTVIWEESTKCAKNWSRRIRTDRRANNISKAVSQAAINNHKVHHNSWSSLVALWNTRFDQFSEHIRQNRRTNIPPVKVDTFYISDGWYPLGGMPDIISVLCGGIDHTVLLLIKATAVLPNFQTPDRSVRPTVRSNYVSFGWTRCCLSPPFPNAPQWLA